MIVQMRRNKMMQKDRQIKIKFIQINSHTSFPVRLCARFCTFSFAHMVRTCFRSTKPLKNLAQNLHTNGRGTGYYTCKWDTHYVLALIKSALDLSYSQRLPGISRTGRAPPMRRPPPRRGRCRPRGTADRHPRGPH